MKTVFKGVHGSHLYGLNTPESDMDYKSVFIPPMRDLLRGNVKSTIEKSTSDKFHKNDVDDVDNTWISLRKFLHLACEGETFVLDMLHTTPEHTIQSSPVWEYIQRNRSMFYSTDMSAYMGYVMKQASKYGVKGSRLAALRQVVDVLSSLPDEAFEMRMLHITHLLPKNEFCYWENSEKDNMTYYLLMGRKYMQTIKVKEFSTAVEKLWNEYGERARKAEANEGIDWKALSHAMRGGYQLQEIFKTGDLVYPLKDRETILKVKLGQLPFKDVQELLNDVVNDVESLIAVAKRNGFQSTPDLEFWDKFCDDVYSDEMRNFLK
ncbi:MAG: DNA polymerase beta superfamily protein [Bacilli bacterium]